MHTTSGGIRRIGATVTAVALALLGSVALAAPASAADNVPTADGMLTIHKFEQPLVPGGLNNSGEPLADTSGWVPLTGVGFTIQEITDVDLETTEGWELAADYAADPSTADSLGVATTVTTGTNGSIATTLPIGAYLVTEIASPGATLPGGDTANITMTAAPFVVTVPVPTAGGTWNSDVHVYPKNSLSSITKAPGDPSALGLGATMPWTIEVKIPTLTAGDEFDQLLVTDTLAAQLAYVAGSATMTVDGTAVEFTDSTAGQDVSLAVSGTGFGTLTAHQGETLMVTFDTTVIAAGAIDNTASVVLNGSAPIESDAVTTYWGQIQIVKHAEGDEATRLAGAVFTVHSTEADGTSGANPIEFPGGQTEFTTLADGTVVIPGLFVGNEATSTTTYWLHEVEAPAGYTVNPVAVPVTLSADAVAAAAEILVPNPQVPAISLPVTGGDGTMALMIGGGGLLLLAAGAALVIARRRPVDPAAH